MSLPIINYKFLHAELDQRLQDLLAHKLESLERYVGDESDVRIEAEFEKITTQQNGDVFRLEVNFWLSGTLYRAEATTDQFEKSIDEVRGELDKEMRRAHKKRENLYRRGRRMIKEMMRFGRSS